MANNPILETLTIDGVSMDTPQGSEYTAGANIEIVNAEIKVKDSPAFTGTPTSPTNSTNTTKNTQIATTAFVQNAINRRLPSTNNSQGADKTQSVASGSTVNIDTGYTIPAKTVATGTVFVRFAANATGVRYVSLTMGSTGLVANARIPACGTGNTEITIPFCANNATNSAQSIIVTVYHNAGSALNVTVNARSYNIAHGV